jgi:hypothetical protein
MAALIPFLLFLDGNEDRNLSRRDRDEQRLVITILLLFQLLCLALIVAMAASAS